ncbi:MAG: aspartate aminotransferase family protein [Actinobacteria bacterium]|nr:aspartate aminotransferase family protein [Actinomycetota bacterium]
MFDDPNAFQRLVEEFYPYRERFETFRRLPEKGRDAQEVLGELRWMAEREDEQGHAGRVSGSLYHGDPEHYAFLTEAFGLFAHANVLQRDMYPSATKFEAEIVAMAAGMLGGQAAGGVCGVLTGGGTESLTTQLLTYRDHAKATRGVTDPQVIIPVTGHCALDKAAHYFGVELVKAPVDDDWRVDVDWVRAHVTDRTVALMGSAGNYPHGVVDPIAELGEVAAEHGIGLHVDACLGGFVLPWARRLGYEVPPFDFAVPGVTSISVDTHKYGFGLKGTSVLLYRDRDLRRHQYFTAADWPGGIYISPGMAGSRSGGLIASTWAAMVTLGEEGYLEAARQILAAADTMRAGVEAVEGIELIGRSPFMVAFRSNDPDVDVYVVNDELIARGWRLNGIQLPPGLHFCVTRPNSADGVVEQFLADLRAAVDAARGRPAGSARSGALYGLSGAGPAGVQAAGQLLSAALDAFYEPAP